jgi:hypothetical protein
MIAPTMVKMPPEAQKSIDDAEVLISEALVDIGVYEVKLEAARARVRLLRDMIESVRRIYL